LFSYLVSMNHYPAIPYIGTMEPLSSAYHEAQGYCHE
jgi:hypothetical protein